MIVVWPSPTATALVEANRVAARIEAQLVGLELTITAAGWVADYLPTGPERAIVEANANRAAIRRAA